MSKATKKKDHLRFSRQGAKELLDVLKNDPMANGMMFADERLRLEKGEMKYHEAVKIICRIGTYLFGKSRLKGERR